MADQMPNILPLDPSGYNLNQDEVAFFKSQTGIQDEDELRDHVLKVQAEAYAVYPYPCIRALVFTSWNIPKFPCYETILQLGKERPNAILLDLGCCLGNDIRKVIADGFPREQVVASDLHREFWELGHKLFKSTQETFPVCFLTGDIFNPAFLRPTASPAPTSTTVDPPPLSTLKSLTLLQRQVSIIHAGSFFHLFSEAEQRKLAHLLATLLSPLPGSMIIGSHVGVEDTDGNKSGDQRTTVYSVYGRTLFTHSPRSWEELWIGKDGVFKREEVVLWTKVLELPRDPALQVQGDQSTQSMHILRWSVTRV